MFTVCTQMDVFSTFIELLRQTGNVTKGQVDMNELRQVLLILKGFWFICTVASLWGVFLCTVCNSSIFGIEPYFHGANGSIQK